MDVIAQIVNADYNVHAEVRLNNCKSAAQMDANVHHVIADHNVLKGKVNQFNSQVNAALMVVNVQIVIVELNVVDIKSKS